MVNGKTSVVQKKDGNQTDAEILLDDHKKIITQDSSLEITIHVALGSEAPFHDRFLCIDNNIWLLGSSFNSFGERGSMIVRIPAPSMVQHIISQAWHSGMKLDDFVASLSTVLPQQ